MKIFGSVNVVMGAVIAALPVFNNCSYDGKLLTLANGNTVPMKCLWTAQAEIAVGVSLAALGILLLTNRGGEAGRSLGILGMILGAFVILLPTALIGVCGNMTASCNQIMRPALILLGGLTMAANLGVAFISHRRLGSGTRFEAV